LILILSFQAGRCAVQSLIVNYRLLKANVAAAQEAPALNPAALN
jgi:hypothetical protein